MSVLRFEHQSMVPHAQTATGRGASHAHAGPLCDPPSTRIATLAITDASFVSMAACCFATGALALASAPGSSLRACLTSQTTRGAAQCAQTAQHSSRSGVRCSAAAGGPPRATAGQAEQRNYRVALITGGNTGRRAVQIDLSFSSRRGLQAKPGDIRSSMRMVCACLSCTSKPPSPPPCRHRFRDRQGPAPARLLCSAGMPQPGARRGGTGQAAVRMQC